MNTLKNGLKQENIDSDDIETILVNYSHRNCVKVALYYAEDCFHLNPRKEARICIDLVKRWLNDEKSVKKNRIESCCLRC